MKDRILESFLVKQKKAAAAISAASALVSVIPGGQSVEQVKANRAILDKPIPAALWGDLKAEGLMRTDAPTD